VNMAKKLLLKTHTKLANDHGAKFIFESTKKLEDNPSNVSYILTFRDQTIP